MDKDIIYEVRELAGYVSDSETSGSLTPIWSDAPHFRYSPLSSRLYLEDMQNWDRYPCCVSSPQNEIDLTEIFDSLEVYFELTQLCNFRCPGCAVGLDALPENKRYDISGEKIVGWVDDIFDFAMTKGYSKIKIKYAGGEPLLPNAKKTIHTAHEYISKKSSETKILIDEVVITNGSLLASSIDFIKEHKLRVNISFWGYGEGNDKQRGSCGMTFPRIIEGLRKVLEAKIPTSITYVITSTNGDQLPELLRLLYNKDHESWIGRGIEGCTEPLPLHIAFFRPQNVLQYHKFLKEQGHEAIIKGVRSAIKTYLDMLRRGIDLPPFTNMFDYLDFDNTFTNTCGSESNYIAIGSSGAGSCHESLRTTDVTQDILKDSEMFMNNISSGQIDLRGLPLLDLVLNLHGGKGCPKLIPIENKFKSKPSYARSVYRPIVEEILSLEGMRRERENNKIGSRF